MSNTGEPIVKIKQGLLRGQVETNYKGGKYYSFKGIPFAEPPVGQLRFKAPRPPKPWEGIRDALSDGSACRSRHMLTTEFIGSEDCLYVNVFTPSISDENASKDKLRPVLFFIHGGAFIMGSNSTELYGADFLLTQDIVLVTTNYRLGALGSLGFKDPKLDVPGNNGLKDCLASLKWVQENIKSFGGDPNNVTIFGESAGSATCHYLVLCSAAKGLFHRAIMQSGVANAPWAVARCQPELLAKALGYDGSNNEKDIYEFLLTVPVEKLIEAQEKVNEMEGFQGGFLAWAPIIETTGCPTEPNFLTKHPSDIIKSGEYNHVPLIFGYNSDEGLLMTGRDSPPNVKGLLSVANYELLVPEIFGLPLGSPERKQLGQRIKEFYWGDKTPSAETFQGFVNYTTDLFFLSSIVEAVKLHTQTAKAPVYLYRFCVNLPFSLIKKHLEIPFDGCSHADELPYLFSSPLSPPVSSVLQAEQVIDRMVKLWTNFAGTGNADPSDKKDPLLNFEWKPVDLKTNAFNCLNIDLNVELKQHLVEGERLQFWAKLMKK